MAEDARTRLLRLAAAEYVDALDAHIRTVRAHLRAVEEEERARSAEEERDAALDTLDALRVDLDDLVAYLSQKAGTPRPGYGGRGSLEILVPSARGDRYVDVEDVRSFWDWLTISGRRT